MEIPLFITLVPEYPDSVLTEYEWKQHYLDSGYVYKNIRLLFRTEAYLKRHSKLSYPACYREAIDYVHQTDAYHEEPEGLGCIAEEHSQKAQDANYKARRLSNLQSIPLQDIDPRCAMLTRDGEISESVVLFNTEGGLLHGGNFEEQQDRENSTVSLAKKHVKGIKDPNKYCTRAVVGKDILFTTKWVSLRLISSMN